VILWQVENIIVCVINEIKTYRKYQHLDIKMLRELE